MSPHSLEARIVYALAWGCLIAAPSTAQVTRVTGPFAGLFGGGPKVDQSLDLRGSLFGAYEFDPSAVGDQSNSVDPAIAQNGVVRGVDGVLAYRRRGDRSRLTLNGTSGFLQYPGSPLGGTYSADTELNVNLTSKLVVDARANYSQSAFYQFAPSLTPNPISSVPLNPAYDFRAVMEPNTTLDGALSVTSNYSKRSSLTADVRWSRTRFSGDQTRVSDAQSIADFRDVGADLSFQHHISRPLAFHVGYGRDQIREAGTGPSPIIETIDVGLDYAQQLSFARRTTLSFGTSTAAVRFERETDYRLDGTAMLTRAFARTWSVQAAYIRETTFMPGFGKPVLSDAVEGSIGGLISSRLHWSSTGGFSRGEIGFDSSEGFGVYTASSMLQMAITRVLGLFAQYSFYRYHLPAESTELSLPPVFSHHAVTVGLTAWVPILNPRSPSDSR